MEKITTSLDQHGRMLIPVQVREKFNLAPGDKVILEMSNNALKILNVNHLIDEMHNIFTKNNNGKKISEVEEFIKNKREDFTIEQARSIGNEQ